MNDLCIYGVTLRGQVGEEEINSMSPLHVTVERVDADVTLVTAYTDQSGIIGLLRHLHGLGMVFLSVGCMAELDCAPPTTKRPS